MTTERERRLVSVLMVAHDAGPFLEEAVASVRAQTYPWKELVLVDNGSRDGSVEAVRREWGDSEGLSIVRSERNLGPAGGACLGLGACRGAFIARLDADDLARPDRLAVQVGFLQARPHLGAVGSDAWCIDAEGRPIKPRLALRTEFLRRHGSCWVSACPHSSLLVRREEAEARFYNATLGGSEDLEWIEWLARQGRLGIVTQPLIYYRLHEGSLGSRLAAFQGFTGAEMRRRISAAGEVRAARMALATEDFSDLATDPRVDLDPQARAEGYLAQTKAERNWLGAAYFATICGRYREFPGLVARAIAARQGLRAALGLVVMRTLWPVWKRGREWAWKSRFWTESAAGSDAGLEP